MWVAEPQQDKSNWNFKYYSKDLHGLDTIFIGSVYR